MSTRKRKVEDAKNGSGESTPKRNTSDVSMSQPSTQEDNFSSDGSLSWSVEYVCQKLEELGLPEAANKFRGKKTKLVNLMLLWSMVFNATINNISVTFVYLGGC